MAEDPLELIGVTLEDRYRVDSVVDEGELSLSYKGVDVSRGIPVVVRCLHLPTTLDPSLAGPFFDSFHERTRLHRRMAPACAAFVQILSDGETVSLTTGQKVPYEVREWLDATTFAAHRAAHPGPIPLDEVLRLLAPVAEGLTYVHDMGTFHGEINPNHLLVVAGEPPLLKIVDFGEGRAPDDKGAGKPVLRLLVPEYAAPEQVDKQLGAMGAWSDVFSLGVLVLECLAGGLPKVAASVVTDPKNRPTPKKLGLKLPGPVSDLLERALATTPAERPPSAAAFWRDLKVAAAPPKAAPVVSVAGDKGLPPPPPRVSGAPMKPTKPPLPVKPSPLRTPSGMPGIAAPGTSAHAVPGTLHTAPMPSARPNPLVKATLIGISPQQPISSVPPPPPPPPPGFEEEEGPTRRRDGLDEPPVPMMSLQPGAMPASQRAEMPFVSNAPPPAEEPDVFMPALMQPSIFTRAKGAIVAGYAVSREWMRETGWPWFLARAKDERPKARAAFGGSVLGTLLVFGLFLRLCLGGGSPTPASAAVASGTAVPTSGTTVTSVAAPPTPTATTTAPAEVPPPEPVAEMPSSPAAAAGPVAFTKAGAGAALDSAGSDLSECKALGTLRGPGSLRVAFAKTGSVAKISIGPPYADTPEGVCILDKFARAQMAPLKGAGGAVNYTFNLAK